MKFPTYEQMAKDVAEKALDEILYDGKTIREWIRIIAEQEPRTGNWIVDEYGIKHCSNCSAINTTVYDSYCANCGAEMGSEELYLR